MKIFAHIAAIALLITSSIQAYAQVDIKNVEMNKFKPAFRFGAGFISKLYIETGVALHRYYQYPPNSRSHNIYAAIETTTTWYQDRGFLLLAPKVGYQFHLSYYAIGVETKYLSDGGNEDFVLALKAGFSLLGCMDLMYSYLISSNNYPFPGIGADQFSLVFTFNRRAYSSKKINAINN